MLLKEIVIITNYINSKEWKIIHLLKLIARVNWLFNYKYCERYNFMTNALRKYYATVRLWEGEK